MRLVALLCVAAWLLACGASRPPSPPAGEPYEVPEDALPLEGWLLRGEDELVDELIAANRIRITAMKEKYPDGPVPYNVLALSGGGSRGAYGAGLLVGLSEAGKRPEFQVVTGISTGALMATAAFLGPEYDESLRLFTTVDSDEIFEPRNFLAGILGDSFARTTPLRALIEREINEATLAAVAREYAKGRRLFIGTTNLDAKTFTIWDMGAIASSDSPLKLDRYHDAVLASASIPVLFPPVYIPVHGPNGSYSQMHVDGGVRETVFYYDFLDIWQGADDLLAAGAMDAQLYLLHNGALFTRGEYEPVEPSSLPIAMAAIQTLMRKNILSSIYRLYVHAMISDAGFHLSFIPPDFPLEGTMADFDREQMTKLFEFARQRARNGDAWQSFDAVETSPELREQLHPSWTIDFYEARPEFQD